MSPDTLTARSCRIRGTSVPVAAYHLGMKAFWLVPVAGLMLTGCGKVEPSNPVHETRAVEVGAAESARVELDIGAGELYLAPGAAQLLDATFDYDPPSMKPDISYHVAAKRGYLAVRQPSLIQMNLRHVRESRWDIKLNEKVPIELRVKVGAGKSALKAAGLSLTRLNIEIGAGEMELDLRGPWTKDLDAQVQGGIGEATVRLPKDVGVRVRAQGGIGEIRTEGLQRSNEFWVNDQYGKSTTDIRLGITGGIGTIRLIGS